MASGKWRSPWVFVLLAWSALSTGCRCAGIDEGVLYACEPEGGCGRPDDLCAAHGLCVPRAWAPRIELPEQGRRVGLSVPVKVLLASARSEPSALSLKVVKRTDEERPPMATLQLGRVGAGTFEGRWAPEFGEGTYELTARDETLGLDSPPLKVEVDATPPRFLIEVSGSGPDTKRRRDEKVEVRVRSEDSDVEAGSVRLGVTGVRAGGRAEVSFGLAACDGEQGGGYCGRSEIDLSRPKLEALEGTFMLQVTGADQAGNSGTAEKGLQVTRLKWQKETESPLSGPPLLDTHGTLYVDMRGWVNTFRPDGSSAPIQSGFVLGGQQGMALGPVSEDGPEVLYLLRSSSEAHPARLVAFDMRERREVGTCQVSDARFLNGESLVLGTGQAGAGGVTDVALAAFRDDQGQIEYLTLGMRSDASWVCLSGRSNLTTPLRLFANGSRFYADSDGKLEEVAVEGAGLVAQRISAPCVSSEVDLMAGPLLIGLEPEWSFAYDTRTGRCDSFQVGGERFTEVSSEVRADSQGRLLLAKKRWGNGGLALSRITRGASEVTEFLSSEAAAPNLVLGADGQLYGVMNEGSRLQVWTPGLEAAWGRDEPSTPAPSVGSTLDCARDAQGQPLKGGLGVWYVAEGSRLSAILVDSPGLDAEADWPGSRHDPQGTGNAAARLHFFQCPSLPQAEREGP